ncbi:MAG: ATP phosphoribosyltransferase regulatory subunit [Bacillota bacterium]
MPFLFEKPIGTNDVMPEKVLLTKNITSKAKNLLEKWGYEEIETPIVEYHQTVGLFSKIQDDKLIKFLDPLGKTVILRPDFTAPIARFVSSVYQDIELPIRLMYQGKVYRNNGSQGINELNQIGLELIGIESLEGDAEVITLAVKLILECTNSNFTVSIGHTKFLELLFQEIGCSETVKEQLFKRLLEHDYVGYKNLVKDLDVNDIYKDYLYKVLKFRGTIDDVLKGKDWFDSLEWHNIFAELSNLWNILDQYNIIQHVCFDLSLVGRQNYYTGLIYNVYCEGNPYPICSGGRYDGLLKSFGREAAATGFAVNVDVLLRVINDEEILIAPQRVLVLFAHGQRLKAIEKAQELRSKGLVVIMAPAGSVSEGYQKGFGQVISID